MTKTIKEIYGYDYIKNPTTSLLKHMNQILDKTIDELNIDDICLLIRQKRFLDIVIPKAIKILINNPAAGDNYEYCLLVNLSTIDYPLIMYKDEINTLITVLEEDYSSTIFELESDKRDYLDSIKRLKEKICS